MTSFLILHGFAGSTNGHWQQWLSGELSGRGYSVYFPHFSDWFRPLKTVWLAELKRTVLAIPKEEPLVVVAHSLGCLLWFHFAAQEQKRRAARVLLVSPPAETLGEDSLKIFYPDREEPRKRAFEGIRTFYPFPSDKTCLKKAAKRTLIVTSTTDPFLPASKRAQYDAYGVPMLVLPAMGHINVQSGYGPWPWILSLCLGKELPSPAGNR
ncbi:MAG: alpha/beta hydrolase [Sporolactobacillus sp.]|nr:alpha/beta hydrolase [Sporolactobacillus sp.]